MASTPLTRNGIAKRRSNRIALSTPVGLAGEDDAKAQFSISAKASNLNKHGAAVSVSRQLVVGQTILLKNKRGAQISARVVAQVGAGQGVHTYGIEFVEQDAKASNFWGITFPSNA